MDQMYVFALQFQVFLMNMLPNLVLALLIFLAGTWLIRKLVRFLRRRFHNNSIDLSLSEFLISIMNAVLYVLLIISSASQIGIPTSSFVAALGAAGLAVGLALQGSLSNFAGGVLILLFKPFRVGHNISSSNNVSGTVLKIDILYTTLKAGNGTMIYAPNGPLANAVINNLTDSQTRQAEYKVSVALDTDIELARRVVLAFLAADPLILQDPKPAFLISSLNDGSINLLIRYWTATADFWPVYYANYQKLVETLDAHAIKLASKAPEVHVITGPQA